MKGCQVLPPCQVPTAFYWPSAIIYQPVQLYTDSVPPSINQYQPILTQYHHMSNSTAFYWPSTTKYQPPSTDLVPSYINQSRSILTQYHQSTKYQPVLTYTVVAWGFQTSAQFTLGLVCIYFVFIKRLNYQICLLIFSSWPGDPKWLIYQNIPPQTQTIFC